MSHFNEMDPRETVVTKAVKGLVVDIVAKLCELIESRGLKLFAIVDHSGEARRAGLELRDTKVVIFGSPLAGTPVMQSVPLVALDLPLKMLIWDDDGSTKVSYTNPDALAARYQLSDELAQLLNGIGPISDALVAT
jgi:uncharacterized protein (DUF302 family)